MHFQMLAYVCYSFGAQHHPHIDMSAPTDSLNCFMLRLKSVATRIFTSIVVLYMYYYVCVCVCVCVCTHTNI